MPYGCGFERCCYRFKILLRAVMRLYLALWCFGICIVHQKYWNCHHYLYFIYGGLAFGRPFSYVFDWCFGAFRSDCT